MKHTEFNNSIHPQEPTEETVNDQFPVGQLCGLGTRNVDQRRI